MGGISADDIIRDRHVLGRRELESLTRVRSTSRRRTRRLPGVRVVHAVNSRRGDGFERRRILLRGVRGAVHGACGVLTGTLRLRFDRFLGRVPPGIYQGGRIITNKLRIRESKTPRTSRLRGKQLGLLLLDLPKSNGCLSTMPDSWQQSDLSGSQLLRRLDGLHVQRAR